MGAGTHYTKLVLLNSVGSAGHVVHSAPLDWCEMLKHYFSCSSGTGAVSIKRASGQVTSNLCFCIRWDMRVTLCLPVYPGHETSMHYFSCSYGTGTDSTKCVSGTPYVELVFLHPVGSAGHVVQCGASRA
jgi:hypothetical protein